MAVDRTSAVSLEFQLDRFELNSTLAAIAKEVSVDPQGAPIVEALPVTSFVMPVRFRAMGKNVFAGTDSERDPGWRMLPILNLAIEGPARVRDLTDQDEVEIPLWLSEGWILIRREGDTVVIRDAASKSEIRAPYRDTLAAFVEFSGRCRLLLRPLMPDIRQHSNGYLANWLYS